MATRYWVSLYREAKVEGNQDVGGVWSTRKWREARTHVEQTSWRTHDVGTTGFQAPGDVSSNRGRIRTKVNGRW
jgi:hypothetical protein